MAQLFEDEKKYPDNRTRDNFIFLGYPYQPALPRDDYQRVIRDLQGELPVRLWYFLDEITTTEPSCVIASRTANDSRGCS